MGEFDFNDGEDELAKAIAYAVLGTIIIILIMGLMGALMGWDDRIVMSDCDAGDSVAIASQLDVDAQRLLIEDAKIDQLREHAIVMRYTVHRSVPIK